MAARGVSAAQQRLRQADAVALRAAGLTFEQIAERTGLKTRSGAAKLVSSGMAAAVQEPADQLRALEAHRYDVAQSRIWGKVLEGDTDAVRTFLKISESRRKLLGLDVPVEFTLRLETEQVEFMELALHRVLDGLAEQLTRAGHGDVVDAVWADVVEAVVAPELEGLTAATQDPAP